MAEFAVLFGLPMFRERLALDYVQRLPALREERLAAAERFAKGSSFWPSLRGRKIHPAGTAIGFSTKQERIRSHVDLEQ